MSLFGQANGNTLKGKINRLTELRGYSAYEIALIHGFSGTEEEWIKETQYYSEQASKSASAAKSSETNAENAKAAALTAQSSAETAAQSAATSATAAKTSEENAKASETAAKAAQDAAEAAANREISWDDLENKPFEDNSILETYDFAVQGVPTVTVKDYIAADQPRYYKISNLTLSHDELLKTVFTYTRNGEVTGSETVTESSFEISNESISVLSVAGQRFLVAYTSGDVGIDHGYASGTITVPETGLYIGGLVSTVFNNSTATIHYIDIKKLDEKFLPEVFAASSADSVKFTKDLITTFEIGNISLENGQAVIPAKGKSLQDVWDTIFVKELLPTVEEPKVTLTAAECKAYEVGTKVTPTYSAVLSEGAYEYGPATGIKATWWTVSNSNKETDVMQDSTIVGAFKEITVEDNTNYHITAVAEHGEGEIPVTNLGNEYPDSRIAAGTKEATSAKITGYRNGFYGTAADKDAAIDSSFVRSLASKSGKTPAAGNVWNLAIPVGAMRIAFAYPATIRDVSSVLDVNGLNAEIKSSFTKYTISVEGANGYDGIDYKVYVLDRATAVTEANTFKITI